MIGGIATHLQSSARRTLNEIVSALLPDEVEGAAREAVRSALAAYSRPLLARLVAGGYRLRVLAAGERYRDASAALQRLGANVDGWPIPPAGLFVVEERTVYLRSLSRMTIGHELGHAIDCALGGGIYRSGVDPAIRAAYAGARAFVTPYAASALDEYMAEALRAYANLLNDDASIWPPATRARLQACDPTMYAIVAELFASAS
jgi:hypothetical protein